MKIALIDVKGCDSRSIKDNTAVNIRNMKMLSKELGAVFFYNAAQLRKIKNNFDVIIFGFGSISSNIDDVKFFCSQKKDSAYYWLVGEYEQSMSPSLYYACKDTSNTFKTIQNFDIKAKNFGKLCNGKHFLNLNLLISKDAPNKINKKYDCVYYSRWRPGREKYLIEYLQGDMFFSSDNKNFKHHKHIGCNPKYIKKLSWEENKETLSLFRYSLYIEDEYTHRVFNNLANRWYEAGYCNNVVFFDRSCINTIVKSEIGLFIDDIEFYIVENKKQLDEKIKECNSDFEKHLHIQREWRSNESSDKIKLIKDIKKILLDGFLDD